MIVEKAPAKINLALDVINKREDNYHNLKMVMTTVDLYDWLSFEKSSKDEIILKSNRHYLPIDKRNLVYKAAHLIKETYHIKTGLKITINKNIPVAAGLAGGSSDAAATIRALNKLFKLKLSLQEMFDLGKQIGSDVPFCIYNKTALVEGVGDIITPLPKVPKCWVILVKPRFGVSTHEIFEKITMDKILHPSVTNVIEAVKNQNYNELCKSLGNSLESITLDLYPEVKNIKEKLIDLNVDAALMSGSGPTIFALVLKERKAKKIINSIDRSKYQTYAVRILG